MASYTQGKIVETRIQRAGPLLPALSYLPATCYAQLWLAKWTPRNSKWLLTTQVNHCITAGFWFQKISVNFFGGVKPAIESFHGLGNSQTITNQSQKDLDDYC
jgi:hypothetical protein